MLAYFRYFFAPPRDLILLVLAAWAGMSLAERRAARHRVPPQLLSTLIFTGLVAYIAGGRILFIFGHLSTFGKNPADIFSPSVSLFDPLAALASAAVAGLVYAQRRQLALWPTLDALTPFLASLAIGLGLSHLATGLAFGVETNLPWAINLWSASRHPTQIYEILAAILVLCLLWFRKADSSPGQTFLLFVALTAGSRLLLEAFRADSTLVLGGIRSAQIIAWIVLAIALFLYDGLAGRQHKPGPVVQAKRQKPVPRPPESRRKVPRPSNKRKATK